MLVILYVLSSFFSFFFKVQFREKRRTEMTKYHHEVSAKKEKVIGCEHGSTQITTALHHVVEFIPNMLVD